MKQAACVYIENVSNGKIVLTNRRGDLNSFGLPGGKVDPGETPIEAAIREVFEETGIVLTSNNLIPIFSQVCKGEVDYETFCFITSIEDGVIPGGQEEGIFATWGDKQQLIYNSPFTEYNKSLLETIDKSRDFISTLL